MLQSFESITLEHCYVNIASFEWQPSKTIGPFGCLTQKNGDPSHSFINPPSWCLCVKCNSVIVVSVVRAYRMPENLAKSWESWPMRSCYRKLVKNWENVQGIASTIQTRRLELCSISEFVKSQIIFVLFPNRAQWFCLWHQFKLGKKNPVDPFQRD